MSLGSFMMNFAEREAFRDDDSTTTKEVDNSNLGINYSKHREANNPQDWWTKANTTRQFVNNLEPRLQYKLIRAFERSSPDLYDLLSNCKSKELLGHKDEIYGVLNNVIGIPVKHLIDCEESITIPDRPGYVSSTPAEELIWIIIMMQIGYHKAQIRMNPRLYDKKGILNGYQFEDRDPSTTADDGVILGKLGIRHAFQSGGSASWLESCKTPQSFAEYMNTKYRDD